MYIHHSQNIILIYSPKRKKKGTHKETTILPAKIRFERFLFSSDYNITNSVGK